MNAEVWRWAGKDSKLPSLISGDHWVAFEGLMKLGGLTGSLRELSEWTSLSWDAALVKGFENEI